MLVFPSESSRLLIIRSSILLVILLLTSLPSGRRIAIHTPEMANNEMTRGLSAQETITNIINPINFYLIFVLKLIINNKKKLLLFIVKAN